MLIPLLIYRMQNFIIMPVKITRKMSYATGAPDIFLYHNTLIIGKPTQVN